MELTVQYLYSAFNKYNDLFFSGVLPKIEIKISRTRNSFGRFWQRTDLRTDIKTPLHIDISKYYKRSQHEIDTTLIHEMIHYYICFMGMKDTNKHGVIFKGIANEISNKSDFKITVTSSSIGLETAKKKIYKVMLFTYKNRNCIAKISSKFDYKDFAKRYKLDNVTVFYASNTEFENFRESRSTLHFKYMDNICFNIKKVA
jgi:predicted SprT family Zn-dependent metalloprotease